MEINEEQKKQLKPVIDKILSEGKTAVVTFINLNADEICETVGMFGFYNPYENDYWSFEKQIESNIEQEFIDRELSDNCFTVFEFSSDGKFKQTARQL